MFKLNKKKSNLVKRPSLMPLPREMKFKQGVFLIDSTFSINLSGFTDIRLQRSAKRFIKRLIKLTGICIDMNFTTKAAATFIVNVEKNVNDVQNAIEDESYTLDVKAKRVTLNSNTIYGALRGIETFIQLVQLADSKYILPEIHIMDFPRFHWRGLLIDATRHWIPPNVIMRNIEAMASVKLNVLHWHLTDDQGFRVESKKYPKLHELGSNGLYYTQEEVKEIVGFASDRGIRIVPEFDMPGHTSSWLVGYPELASSPGPYKIEEKWGGFKPIMNPTLETTYEFIENFLTEMASLFPDQYVHIGGDVMNSDDWQANSEIQNFMKKQGVKDSHKLQTYFNQRLTLIVHELDKEVIGWDPIIDSDLPSSIVIQSARGQKWLSEATAKGFRGIANSEYYLDLLHPASFYYGRDLFSNETGELTIKQQQLILGGEASMWTEFADKENIDSRIWPRAAVVAERLWSSQNVTDVEDMYLRLDVVSERLSAIGIEHISGPQKMLKRLVGVVSVDTLSTLSEILQPNFDVRWNNKDYSSLTPLNRLIDATNPDSATVRLFDKMVDNFLEAPSNEVYRNTIDSQLKVWRDNHENLIIEISNTELLKELFTISETVMQLALIGLKSTESLSMGNRIKQGERKDHNKIFITANQIIEEFSILIVPAVQKLNDAAYKKIDKTFFM